MPREPQIDLIELQQMLDEGKMKQYEMADYFGVTKGAITQAKRRLKRGVVANSTRKQLQGFINKKMDAVEQIQKINTTAHALLNLYMGWIAGDKESLDKLRAQIVANKVKNEAKHKQEAEEEAARFLKTKDPHELAIKIMAEIRGQIVLQLDITKTLYDMKATQEFQEIVLRVIGKVAPDARAEIVRELNAQRAIGGAVKFK